MRCFRYILAGLMCVVPARASETLGDGAVATVNEENDKFVTPSTDQHYTQGLHVTVLWPDESIPFWGHPLTWWPDFGVDKPIHKYGFRTGQNIYTPIDIQTNALIQNDRPYAGWLFLGLVRQDRGTWGDANIPVLDHFEIDAGVVGSWSQAHDTQIWFHGLIHVDQPRGWRHQLNNEPGLLIIYDRKLLIWDSGPDEPVHTQLIPHFGINLGNIETSGTVGMTLRTGYNFPNEFAKSSPARFGWYVFGGSDVRVVGYNQFLDGNLYHESHSVTKEPVVLHVQAGIKFIYHRVEFGYTYHYLTKEFKKQDKYDTYASLDLTCHF